HPRHLGGDGPRLAGTHLGWSISRAWGREGALRTSDGVLPRFRRTGRSRRRGFATPARGFLSRGRSSGEDTLPYRRGGRRVPVFRFDGRARCAGYPGRSPDEVGVAPLEAAALWPGVGASLDGT